LGREGAALGVVVVDEHENERGEEVRRLSVDELGRESRKKIMEKIQNAQSREIIRK